MSVPPTSDDLVRTVLVVLGAVLLIPVLMMAFGMPLMGMMGWWWGGRMMDGATPLWGLGMGLVWLAVLVGVGYVVYRLLANWSGPDAGTDSAMRELRMAYARGDLTEEEFEERRANLRGKD